MPIPNSRSHPPRILAHELRWGRGGGRQPPSVDWWLLNLTAASVPDVSCVPSPCSLDASVAGFYKLVLLYDCAASVLDAGRVPSPCSLDDSVAGFSTLELPPPCAMQRGAGLTVCSLCPRKTGTPCAPSLDAPPGFCAGVNRASRVAVLPCMCSCCQSSASAVLRRRVPSLDALPGSYAGF